MNESNLKNFDNFASYSTALIQSMGYNLQADLAEYSGINEVQERIVESSRNSKTLFAFGLNYKTAPVEIREKLFLNEAESRTFLDFVKGSLAECVVLSTCNRTEIYGVSDSTDIDLSFYKNLLIDLKGVGSVVRDEHFFALISCAACQQLFNVATSIDSKIIGDSQILRQLRGAYDMSRESGLCGKIINQLFQRAFKLGKSTYTATSIHEGAASVSLAAVELANQTFGSLNGRSVLVIGAGETARLTTEALVSKRVGKLLVTNRTRTHAEDLLSVLHTDPVFESEILDFDNFKERLDEVDIIISSTGSERPILYQEDFVGRSRKMLVIDIAVPRDVDDSVRENPNIIVRNIDDLNSIVDENQEKRMMDLPKVREIIIKEMVDFLTWYYLLPILPEYEKTGAKPLPEQKMEILRVKEFLSQNVSEIHKFAARAGNDFRDDLDSHFSLIRRLQTMKSEAFSAAVV